MKDVLQDRVFDRPLVRGPSAGVTCLGALTEGRRKAVASANTGAALPPDGPRRAPSPCLLTNCTAVVLHVSTCISDLQRQTRNVLHARRWH